MEAQMKQLAFVLGLLLAAITVADVVTLKGGGKLDAVWSALHELGLSFKKRPSTRPSRIVRTSRRGVPSGSSGVLASIHAG